MCSEIQALAPSISNRINTILDQVVFKFSLEHIKNNKQASICLPFSLDAGLSLLDLPGLTEPDYRTYQTLVIGTFPGQDYAPIIIATELTAIKQILETKGLTAEADLVDLDTEDKDLLTDFNPTEKQQILIIPTQKQDILHAVSYAGRLPDGRIIVFDHHAASTNFEVNMRGVKIYTIDELTQLIQRSNRPGYLITLKPTTRQGQWITYAAKAVLSRSQDNAAWWVYSGHPKTGFSLSPEGHMCIIWVYAGNDYGQLLKCSYTQDLIFTDGWEAVGPISNYEEVIIGKNSRIENREGKSALIYEADTRINYGYNQWFVSHEEKPLCGLANGVLTY